MVNQEVGLTLDDAVAEVLAQMTGLDLQYEATSDRYYAVTRMLNKALRDNALEQEWSYYASTEVIGKGMEGQQEFYLRGSVRPRIISDDAVRLLNKDEQPVVWAYFMPRDALHKYAHRPDLKVAVTRNSLMFSRPLTAGEAELEIAVPVMREPRMFRLPQQPEDPSEGLIPVDDDVRQTFVDFDYPDLIVARAVWLYAQSDPVAQPRVQTLEGAYKNLMYSLIERDTRHTDTPIQNDWSLPISNGIDGRENPRSHGHPHADWM